MRGFVLLLLVLAPAPAIAQTGGAPAPGHYEKHWHTCWNAAQIPYPCYDSVWVPDCPARTICPPPHRPTPDH